MCFLLFAEKGFPIRTTYTFRTDVPAVPKSVLDARRGGDFPNNFERIPRTKALEYGAKGIKKKKKNIVRSVFAPIRSQIVGYGRVLLISYRHRRHDDTHHVP